MINDSKFEGLNPAHIDTRFDRPITTDQSVEQLKNDSKFKALQMPGKIAKILLFHCLAKVTQ